MGRRAIIVGTGQIGRALAFRLGSDGWSVDMLSRRGTGWQARCVRHLTVDRNDTVAFDHAIGDGADLLIDTVAFDAEDAQRLIAVEGRIDQLIAISSASVYADADGRTLDEAASNGFPELPEWMDETQPTVAPGPATYSTRKVAMERSLLDEAKRHAVVLRPCAIYGIGSTSPREWWIVKRLLDGRARIPLAYGGISRFHTTSVENIAALIVVLADSGTSGIFNIADPDAPLALEIMENTVVVMNSSAELVPIAGGAGIVGRHPWAIPRPFTLSDAAARSAGYVPTGDYRTLSADYVEWLATCDPTRWQQAFPGLAAYPFELFDYVAEDAYFASQRT